jgi:hypothetical protein
MKTLDQVINELSVIRDKVGGNVQVFFDKNGADDGPRSITSIKITGYFYQLDPIDNERYIEWIENYEEYADANKISIKNSDALDTFNDKKVYKLVELYSDRRGCLFDTLE